MRPKSQVLKAVLIFVATYVIFLLLWIQVKGYYGKAVTYTVSQAMPLIKDVQFEGLTQKGDFVQPTFIPLRHKSRLLLDIPMKTSSYTFNIPLTMAILAALSPFIVRKGRAFAEAMAMLIAVHLLYVFSREAKELTEVFINAGYESPGSASLFLYQFLWTFTDNMVIRFEPFLIGFYVFIRFRKKQSGDRRAAA